MALSETDIQRQKEIQQAEELLFSGPIKYYNHKNVYFPGRVDYLFSAKNPAYNSPNLLAAEVRKHGGLIQNNHLDFGPGGRDQFDYPDCSSEVIVNTEISPDTVRYNGETYNTNSEKTLREFLGKGGKTGFVGSTDTHEGKAAARTAVLAHELTRAALFEALGQRRNYAVYNARIVLDFKINGHFMGEKITIDGKPTIHVEVAGTDKIEEAVIVRNGLPLHTLNPKTKNVQFDYVDESFRGNNYYYLRVVQADKDEQGNPSCAWSSPIWVTQRQ
jgi:hypothetical protein